MGEKSPQHPDEADTPEVLKDWLDKSGVSEAARLVSPLDVAGIIIRATEEADRPELPTMRVHND